MFIQNIVSVSEITFEEKSEKNVNERFARNANEFLKSKTDSSRLKINTNVFFQKKIKFNAIITNSQSKITIINYVTGYNSNYYIGSIAKTSMYFQMADNFEKKDLIKNKISIIDDKSNGYDLDKIKEYLDHLVLINKSKLIKWSEKETLNEYLD